MCVSQASPESREIFPFYRLTLFGCDTEVMLSPEELYQQTSLPNVAPGTVTVWVIAKL